MMSTPTADAIAEDEETTPLLPRTGWLLAASRDKEPNSSKEHNEATKQTRILIWSNGLTE